MKTASQSYRQFAVRYFKTFGRLPHHDGIKLDAFVEFADGVLNETVLQEAFKREPKAAIEHLQRKGLQISWSWRDAQDEAHQKAFTVAKVMKADLLQFFQDELVKAQKEGKPLREFQASVIPRLQQAGWWGAVKAADVPRDENEAAPPDPNAVVQLGSLSRLKTIYQTNLQSAFMAGRFKQQQEASALLPYWEFIATIDDNTTDGCGSLNGVILPHDDPFWATNYPPRHYNCRSRVRALNERMLKQKGLTPSNPDQYKDVRAAEGFNATPDAPWRPNTSKYSPEWRAALERDLEQVKGRSQDKNSSRGKIDALKIDALFLDMLKVDEEVSTANTNEALKIISSLFELPDLIPPPTIQKDDNYFSNKRSSMGRYDKEAKSIAINRQYIDGHLGRATVYHEFAHYLWDALGINNDRIKNLLTEISKTNTYTKARQADTERGAIYWTLEEELWARAIAQYICVLGNDSDALKWAERTLIQWTEEEFRPLIKAIEEILTSIGVTVQPNRE